MRPLVATIGDRFLILSTIAVTLVALSVTHRTLRKHIHPTRTEDADKAALRAQTAKRLGLEGEGWILFTSPTCSPCKRVREDLIASACNWIEIDVDTNPEAFKLWNVYRVPTLIWVSDSGKTHERHGPASVRSAIAAR